MNVVGLAIAGALAYVVLVDGRGVTRSQAVPGGGVVPVRKVVRYASGKWWIVDDRGSKERPLYHPISGPFRSSKAGETALRSLGGGRRARK